MYVDYPVYAEHAHPLPNAERIAQGQETYLRTWCDVFVSLIANHALLNGDTDAIKLLIFSLRPALQSPPFMELTISDYWDAMIQFARFAPGGVEDEGDARKKTALVASAPADDAAQAAA